jgi:hypothetical protein
MLVLFKIRIFNLFKYEGSMSLISLIWKKNRPGGGDRTDGGVSSRAQGEYGPDSGGRRERLKSLLVQYRRGTRLGGDGASEGERCEREIENRAKSLQGKVKNAR